VLPTHQAAIDALSSRPHPHFPIKDPVPSSPTTQMG